MTTFNRCDGRYPVPMQRDEPFPVTYRCGRQQGHHGECGNGEQPIPAPPSTPPRTPSARERIVNAGQGWCAISHGHSNADAAITAACEVLTLLDERITANLTPALNTGSAMDMMILVAGVQRELRAELTSVDPVVVAALPYAGDRHSSSCAQVLDSTGSALLAGSPREMP